MSAPYWTGAEIYDQAMAVARAMAADALLRQDARLLARAAELMGAADESDTAPVRRIANLINPGDHSVGAARLIQQLNAMLEDNAAEVA